MLRANARQGLMELNSEVENSPLASTSQTDPQTPHLVPVLAMCKSPYACLVYPFLSNGDLGERLRCAGGLPPLRCAGIPS